MNCVIAVLRFFFGVVLWGEGYGSAYEVVAVTDGGTIRGEVLYAGPPVAMRTIEISKDQEVCGKTEKVEEAVVVGKGRGLENVVVFIADIQKGKGFLETSVVLDQRECRYSPHIVLTPIGRPLTIFNHDGILHSVHTHSVVNPAFNRAQSKFKTELVETFLQPETIPVTCDVHSWMNGWIVTQPHPYFAVTDAEGSFIFTQVPAGQYVLKFWHEVFGGWEESVVVDRGGETRVTSRLGQ